MLPYQDAKNSIKVRVNDLISHMTLEEKVAQTLCIWQKSKEYLFNEKGFFDLEKAKHHFKDDKSIGHIGRPGFLGSDKTPRENAEITNEIQKFFIQNTRLGIPVFIHEEALHGLMIKGATSFPQPIGLAATFNPKLVEEIFTLVAEETRSCGFHQVFAPVLDVARDPRWGRTEETFGEDPHLVSIMGIAVVRGFQGDGNFREKKHVISTVKHFAAHGQPESGTNCAPANYSERILQEVFLFPFKEAIQKGGALGVMASYNEIDGVPSHANRRLLRDVLRNEWGFRGFVVSDYYAITELHERPEIFGHFLAGDKQEAATLALNAGVNTEFPEPDCYPHLIELVRSGAVDERILDRRVAEILALKFKMGLFEDPYVNPQMTETIIGNEKNRELALRAALETITLLKNDKSIAPLNLRKIKTIAVIGPNANRNLLGGYSGIPKYYSSVLDGIKAGVGNKKQVLYHEGCKITTTKGWENDDVRLNRPKKDDKMIEQAVKTAEKADVVVLALGGNEQTSREAWSLSHLGDRTDLQMVGKQMELVRAIKKTGKPIITFLFNGRPLAISELSELVPVIFECWYLGQETGEAVAKVLFGDYNPGGKLPITIPRSVGHIPAYYNYKPSARRGYLFDDVSPLYAFGYGLSYTRFKIKNVHLEKDKMAPYDSTAAIVEISNTGKISGEEVIQMYIRDCVSSVTRPVKELKGFKRIHLDPGETTTVSLDITPESLAFYDINMNYVVEPGEFEIKIGTSCRDEDLQTLTLYVE
jgi:beta-glucosidase